jgi:hypothetical protein
MTNLRPRAKRAKFAALHATTDGAGLWSGTTKRGRSSIPRVLLLCSGVAAFAIFAALYVSGWRLVMLQTGSMGDRAPAGSVALAGPTGADNVEVGDLLVMAYQGGSTVTHEVVELRSVSGVRVAVTQGRMNTSPDPVPYQLSDDALVVRGLVPWLGHGLRFVRGHIAALGLLLGAALMLTPPQRPRFAPPVPSCS